MVLQFTPTSGWHRANSCVYKVRCDLRGVMRFRIQFAVLAMAVGAALSGAHADPGPPTYVMDGRRYCLLRDVGAEFQMTYKSTYGGGQLQTPSQWLEFVAERREATINGTQVWLHYPVLAYRGRPAIAEADVRKTLAPLLTPQRFLARRSAAVVVLDPGHGGEDAGAIGRRNVQEKRVVLDIANRVRVHLANAGMKVYLTRETDRFIPLAERSAKAARWGAHIFVSIHLNASATRMASGVETYVLAAPGCPPTAAAGSGGNYPAFGGNVFDEASVMLGYHLQRALLQKTGGEDRGLRRSRFMVLRNAPCPAALVECGFVSNPREEELMLSAAHREKIALGITQGILNYAKEVQAARAALAFEKR
jgi:N-acetylmuramoyl-L-alanine amidase